MLSLLSCLAGALLYVISAAWVPTDHLTRNSLHENGPCEITGVIGSALERDPGRTAFVLDVHSINSMTASGRLRVSIREETRHIGYGDLVRFTGRPFTPRSYRNPGGFDYTEHLSRNGIRAIANLKNEDAITIIRRGTGMFRAVQDRRERIRQAFLASTGGPGSAILQAMVIGEEGGLADDMRDEFMAAGVTHIISISGSHLGMLAALCFGLIRGAMNLLPERLYHRITLSVDPKKIAALLTLPVVVFYTLLAGGQVATVRSLIMISAGLAAVVFDREHALLHSLAIAAVIILVHAPQAIFDISFQLSFLSVLIIGAVVTAWTDLRIYPTQRLARLGMNALLLVIISFAASLATAPLVAHYFNQFSLAGILSNLVIIPFAGVIAPIGLLSGAFSLITGQLPFAGLNQALADAFIGTVGFFSRLPLSEFHPPAPGIVWIAACGVLVLSLAHLLWCWLRWRLKPFEASLRISRSAVMLAAMAGLVLVLLTVPRFIRNEQAKISFIDVGQGDCTLIELPGGQNILIDGGGSYENRFDVGRRVLEPVFRNKGIRRFDLVILSHPHPDHVNGLLSIIRRFEVDELWTSGRDTDLPEYEELMKIVAAKRLRHTIVSASDPPRRLDDADIRILSPASSWTGFAGKAYAGENNRSLMVRIAIRDRVFLFTGDAGIEAEREMVRSPQMHADVIKIPHHGSKSSSSGPFVAAVQPKIAVVSVGHRNPYRHPSEAVLDRYRETGARIYRTDRDGLVEITIHPSRLTVMTQEQGTLRKISVPDAGTWLEQERANWAALRR